MTIALQTLDDRRSGAGPAPGSDGHGIRYEVAGRLDAETSHEVRDVERTPDPDSVVEIDLRRCEGMDDFGFGSLVGLIRRAREHRAKVLVRGAPGDVREELQRTGVARLVDLLPAGAAR
jgi:anti-anti-sigma regulatory factor